MKKMMKTGPVLLTILILLASLAGCKQEIAEAKTIPKDTERLLNQAQDANLSADQTAQTVPERFVLSTQNADGSLTIQADADVQVTAGATPKTARVVGGGFSQDTVKKLFAHLMQGAQATVTLGDKTSTKDEISQYIANAKAELVSEAYLEHGYTKEEWLEGIRRLEERLVTAPAHRTTETVVSDGSMYLIERDEIQYYELDAFSENAHILARSFENQPATDDDSFFRYYRHKDEPSYKMLDAVKMELGQAIPGVAQGKLKLTYDEAVQIAEGMFAKIDLPVQLVAGYLVGDRETGMTDGTVALAAHYGYKLFYARAIDGISLAINATDDGDGSQTAVKWSYEKIEVIIDDKGIVRFEWNAPLTIRDVADVSSELLSFTDAAKVFETMAMAFYEPQTKIWNEAVEWIQTDVRVTDVRLQEIRVREQNASDAKRGVAIPAWVFYGTVQRETTWKEAAKNTRGPTYQGMGLANGYAWDMGPTIVLAINALDGTIIDTSKGY